MTRNMSAGMACCVLLLAGCAGAEKDGPGPRQVSEAFVAAYNAKDLARIASLYAEDAELMPPDSPLIKGRSAIEALFREKFEQNCTMELSSSASEFSGTHGFDTGRIAVTMNGPEGGSQRVEGKYLAVLKRIGGEWKIAYHMQTVEPQ